MRIWFRVFVLTVMGVAPTAVARDDSTSALERDPKGWTDLLAKAGSELKGWKRAPLPAQGKLSARSQWSLDSSHWPLDLRGQRRPRVASLGQGTE